MFFNAILQGNYLEAPNLLASLNASGINPPIQIWKLALINPSKPTKPSASAIKQTTSVEAIFSSFEDYIHDDTGYYCKDGSFSSFHHLELAGLELNYRFSKHLMAELFDSHARTESAVSGLCLLWQTAFMTLNLYFGFYNIFLLNALYTLAPLILGCSIFILFLTKNNLADLFEKPAALFSVLFALVAMDFLGNHLLYSLICSTLPYIGIFIISAAIGALLFHASWAILKPHLSISKDSILFSILANSGSILLVPILTIIRLVLIASPTITHVLMSTTYLPILLSMALFKFCFHIDGSYSLKTYFSNAYLNYQETLSDVLTTIKCHDNRSRSAINGCIHIINNPFPFTYLQQSRLIKHPQLEPLMNNARLVYTLNLAITQPLTPKEHLFCLLKHYLKPGMFASFFKTTKPHADIIQALLNEFETDKNLTMSYADFRFSTEAFLNADLIGIGEYIRYVLVPMEQKNHYDADPSPEALQRLVPVLL